MFKGLGPLLRALLFVLSAFGLLACAYMLVAGTLWAMPGLQAAVNVFLYAEGVLLFCVAMFEFKAHKDNPERNSIWTPVLMLVTFGIVIYTPSFFEGHNSDGYVLAKKSCTEELRQEINCASCAASARR